MLNFNDAEQQMELNLIPVNTIAKAKLVLKAGDDPMDLAITHGKNGDTAYLNCEFVITEGPYAKRKVFEKIGIEGNDRWVNMGKARIRAILESARNISPKDMSDAAIDARKIDSFEALNGLDVVIKIGIERDKNGIYPDKNRIISIITPDHFAYAEFMHSDTIPF